MFFKTYGFIYVHVICLKCLYAILLALYDKNKGYCVVLGEVDFEYIYYVYVYVQIGTY